MQSTLSHLQLLHGIPSTTSHLTLRVRHDTQARAALRFVCFWFIEASVAWSVDALRFFDDNGTGEQQPSRAGELPEAVVGVVTSILSAVSSIVSSAGSVVMTFQFLAG